MKLKDIPYLFGRSAVAFCGDMGWSPQMWNNYAQNRRGGISKFEQEVKVVTGLNFEQIWFDDAFDHPAGDDSSTPFYWLNLALEALRLAEEKGIDTTEISKAIRAFENQLPELPNPDSQGWEE